MPDLYRRIELADGHVKYDPVDGDKLRDALASCASWLDRWAKHVGNCQGGSKCTCGLTAVSFEANAALADAE